MSRFTALRAAALGSAFFGAFLVGCGGSGTSSSTGGGTTGGASGTSGGASTATKRPIDPATAGAITVKVKFEGKAPSLETYDIGSEKICTEAHPNGLKEETVIVNDDGTLANTFVYVKSGLEGHSFDVPKDPVIFDQKGCQYLPHVFGIMVGQELDIVNSDPILHNVHVTAKANDSFNEGMPTKDMTIKKKFRKQEIPVKVRCDVHNWMNAYACVVNHPKYGVTGKDGTVKLEGLPPGDYTIEIWHEKYGTQTQKVTVGAKETKDVTFTVKGA
jgi:plastocyanin